MPKKFDIFISYCRKAILLIGIIGAIGVQTIGCAAAKATETQPLHSVECEQGELRGFGTGANENEALNAARSSLAMQVHFMELKNFSNFCKYA